MLVSMLVAAAQLLSAVASNVCDGSSLLQVASLETAIVAPAVGPNSALERSVVNWRMTKFR